MALQQSFLLKIYVLDRKNLISNTVLHENARELPSLLWEFIETFSTKPFNHHQTARPRINYTHSTYLPYEDVDLLENTEPVGVVEPEAGLELQ